MATKFTVSQAEFQLEAGFSQAEFSLFRETNSLLDHLFKALQPHGARLADIRVETGGGSAADFNLLCYLFNYWVTLRVRIDRIDIVGYSCLRITFISTAPLLWMHCRVCAIIIKI
jgi:hypothetical protein